MEKLFLKADFISLLRFHSYHDIDNNIFRLHYRVTTIGLFLLSVLVTATQFFGDPIYCIQKDDIPERVINSYCWIEGTFTLPKALNKKVGVEVPYPGVEKYEEGDQVIEHAYYQWVCFVLFLQACLFFLPRILWRMLEKGRVKGLVCGLDNPVLSEQNKTNKIQSLATYFFKSRGQHDAYAFSYIVCESLNFINVVGQMYLLNRFLGGEFTTYGSRVVEFTETEQERRYDPMIRIFPRMTKCRFQRFGSSGDVQKHDALCLLPINIVNEKIFVILWFWFVILSILSGLVLVYRFAFLLSNRFRYLLLRRIDGYSKRSQFIVDVAMTLSYSDWFMISQVGKNIDPWNLRCVLKELMRMIQKSGEEKVEDKETESKDANEEVPLV